MRVLTSGVESQLIQALADLPLRTPAPNAPGSRPIRTDPVTSGALDGRRDASGVLGGRVPTKPTALFEHVRNLCAAGEAGLGSPAEVEALFRRLGFKSTKPGRLVKGSTKVKLELFELAGRTGVRLEVKGRERGDRVAHEGVVFAGALLRPNEVEAMCARYEEEIEAFLDASKGLAVEDLPTSMLDLKLLVDSGRTEADQREKDERKAQIDAAVGAITEKIAAARAAGTAPKGVVVYVSGPDAVGKTSTGRILMDAFQAAGYEGRRESFKAPSEAERAAPHERFRRGFAEEGQIVFWDRGPAGDVAYGGQDPADVAAKFATLERELEADGVMLVKIQLTADVTKQLDTLGKRMARKVIAERIGSTLDAHGLLDDDKQAGLDAIAAEVDLDDFNAVANYDAIRGRFRSFVDASDPSTWIVRDSTQRHEARLELAAAVEALLG